MRLIHAIPHVDEEASGPSYSTPRLCHALAERGHQVELFSLARGRAKALCKVVARTFPEGPKIARLGLSDAMRRGLAAAAKGADVLHSHSLWMMPNVYPAWAAARTGAPLVVSPRGALSPVALARSPRRKRLFWDVLQGPAVRQASLIHATSELEYRDVRAFGLAQPVAVIPNGVDVARDNAVGERPAGQRRLLYLGRLHPIKGLNQLLAAWADLRPRFPDWELRLVGPDEGGYGEALRREMAGGLYGVRFVGAQYGADKRAEYAAAELFVLPSHSENFGMAVAEALAAGRPVVTTTGTPWAGLAEHGCGWRVAPTAEGLGAALAEAMALDREILDAMGARGRDWMARDFGWPRLGEAMETAYRWLLDGGAAPDCLRLS